MSGFDGTGPSGAGPGTGGRRGACTGFGRRGWRNRFFGAGFAGADLEALKARPGYFEKLLDEIRRRIQKLEPGT